jgi:hypothetical protein
VLNLKAPALVQFTAFNNIRSNPSFNPLQMDDDSKRSLFYCTLLAVQFGLQPILASRFTANDISKSSVVIATELGKMAIAFLAIFTGSKAERELIWKHWSIMDSLKVAALPATLYAIQNLLVQYGYVLLDSMTFNLLNQTKVKSIPRHSYLLFVLFKNGLLTTNALSITISCVYKYLTAIDVVCRVLVVGSYG